MEFEEKFEEQEAGLDFGTPVFSWSFKEYEQGHRSKQWYVIASIFGIALLAYAIITRNFTFAFLIILFGIVYFLFEIHEAQDIAFEITDTGIRYGRNFFPFKELKKFWIIYLPPEVMNLYLRTDSAVHSTLTVPLSEQNPVEIREHLLQFLPEDLEKDEMPLSESLGKIFKL